MRRMKKSLLCVVFSLSVMALTACGDAYTKKDENPLEEVPAEAVLDVAEEPKAVVENRAEQISEDVKEVAAEVKETSDTVKEISETVEKSGSQSTDDGFVIGIYEDGTVVVGPDEGEGTPITSEFIWTEILARTSLSEAEKQEFIREYEAGKNNPATGYYYESEDGTEKSWAKNKETAAWTETLKRLIEDEEIPITVFEGDENPFGVN